jgi:hypothetical protein
MLLHVPKTGLVLLHASKVKRVPIPCGLQTAGKKANLFALSFLFIRKTMFVYRRNICVPLF